MEQEFMNGFLVCLVRGLAIILLFRLPQTAAAPADVNNLSDAISPQMPTYCSIVEDRKNVLDGVGAGGGGAVVSRL